MPASTRITPEPGANINNIKIDNNILLVIAAKLIIPARIGVEQGVPPMANIAPKIIGYKYFELLELDGILNISVGIFKSKIPNKCRPITSNNEAINNTKYPPVIEINTLPVTAQSTPMILNTIAEPNINDVSCSSVVLLLFLLNPPIYPITFGNIANEHGERDAIKPPKKDKPNSIKRNPPVVSCSVKVAVISIIILTLSNNYQMYYKVTGQTKSPLI